MQAAKRCLNERGYSQTSARDIASEAGVSTAAIGYHYGTKDALLMEALLEALAEWGAVLGEKLVAPTAPGTTAGERFRQNWERVIQTFATDRALVADPVRHARRHGPQPAAEGVPVGREPRCAARPGRDVRRPARPRCTGRRRGRATRRVLPGAARRALGPAPARPRDVTHRPWRG